MFSFYRWYIYRNFGVFKVNIIWDNDEYYSAIFNIFLRILRCTFQRRGSKNCVQSTIIRFQDLSYTWEFATDQVKIRLLSSTSIYALLCCNSFHTICLYISLFIDHQIMIPTSFYTRNQSLRNPLSLRNERESDSALLYIETLFICDYIKI